ncbi:acyl-CoA N-acyltransferase [Pavlovales sp. CCMP2436]|nr:acyl-CoA N-acyltransferase [Pavlovales sp. CCMP2436]
MASSGRARGSGRPLGYPGSAGRWGMSARLLSHLVLPLCSAVGAFEVRLAQPRDAGSIALLMRKAFRGSFSITADSPLVCGQLALMEFNLRSQLSARLRRSAMNDRNEDRPRAKEAVLIAAGGDDGALLGCADVRMSCFNEATGEHHGEIPLAARQNPAGYSLRPYMANLAVANEARRRGVGRALVRSCECWALDSGFDSLTLEVVGTNEPALDLYRGLGYMLSSCEEEVCVAVRKQFWIEEEWLPKLRLVRYLRDDEVSGAAPAALEEGAGYAEPCSSPKAGITV